MYVLQRDKTDAQLDQILWRSILSLVGLLTWAKEKKKKKILTHAYVNLYHLQIA